MSSDNDILKDSARLVGRITVGWFMLGIATLAFVFGGFLLFLSIMGLAAMVWWFPYIFMAALPFILIIVGLVAIFKK